MGSMVNRIESTRTQRVNLILSAPVRRPKDRTARGTEAQRHGVKMTWRTHIEDNRSVVEKSLGSHL